LKYKQIASFSVPDTVYKNYSFLQPVPNEGSSTFLASSMSYCSDFINSKKNKGNIIALSGTYQTPTGKARESLLRGKYLAFLLLTDSPKNWLHNQG